MTAPAPKKGPAKLIIIIAIAVVAAAGIAVGIIFGLKGCSGGATGSYKDAVTDLASMFSNGKYIEAMEKYSVEGKAPDMGGMESYLSLLSGVKWEITVDEAASKVYQKGDPEFESNLKKVTTNDTYASKATEVAVVKAHVKMSGNVMGQDINQESDTTFYMARIDGAWKLDASGALS